MMSARSASSYNHANAAKYCYNLSAAAAIAMNGDTTTIYTDWRLPTIGEAAVFEGTANDSYFMWTATIYEATNQYWIRWMPINGSWDGYDGNVRNGYVRCVR